MHIVKSLETLIQKLKQSDTSNHGKIIRNINIPLSDFEAYASWNDEGYTRNCICRTKECELILLCWNKGAATPIHGHDGQKCWVYQIEGQMTEVRYEKFESGDLFETNRMQLNPGKITFMNNAMGYHELINDTDGRAMTLHAYILPIDSCEVYCEEEEGFKSKDMEYDTVEGNTLAEI